MSGPALTAVWSKAPPLTTHCLSPLLGFEYPPGHVRKLPVTLGKAIAPVSSSASHELATIGIHMTDDIQNSKPKSRPMSVF